MASLDLGTLVVNVKADASSAINDINKVDEAIEKVDKNGKLRDAKESFLDMGKAGVKAGDDIVKSSEKASVSVRKTTSDISKRLSDVGKNMTKYITVPLVGLAAASVKTASDLTETLSKTREVFKGLTDQTLKWSETSIKTMGLAQGTALDAASGYADMGTSMGQTTAEAFKMSTSLTQLAADMSSFKNISFDRTQLALTAIYTGETEAMKALGIVMTEDNLKAYALSQGMSTLYKDMSQAERVALRYQYVMAMTANAQGDFVRTGGNTANQTRKLVETVKQLGASFGELMLPAVNSVVGGLQSVVSWLVGLDDGAKNAIITVGAIAAAIGPLLLLMAKIPIAIEAIKKGLVWFAGSPVAIGITVAAAAIAGLIAVLQANKREVDKNSDSYKRLQNIVKDGVKGKVEVDDGELTEVTGKDHTVTIDSNIIPALTRARSIADTIAKNPELYDGVITINGADGTASSTANQLQATINGLSAAITVNASGTDGILSSDKQSGKVAELIKRISETSAALTVDDAKVTQAQTLVDNLDTALGELNEAVTINIESSQLTELTGKSHEVTITANTERALETVKGLANDLLSDEYKGSIQIDGNTALADTKLTTLRNAINEAKESIKISADGKSITGSYGVLHNLRQAIFDTYGTVGVNTEQITGAQTLVDSLKAACAEIIGKVSISVSGDNTAKDRIDKTIAKLNSLRDKDVKLSFETTGQTADEIQEYAEAIAAAAGAVDNFDASVEALDNLTDKRYAENLSSLNQYTSSKGLELGRAYNNGALTEEEYQTEIKKLYDEYQTELAALQAEAEAEKEQHAMFNDGSKENDPLVMAEIYADKTKGENVTGDDYMNAAQRLGAAYEGGGGLSDADAKIVNTGLINQAIEAYNGLTAATEKYNAAKAETNEKEEADIEGKQQEIEANKELQQAVEDYGGHVLDTEEQRKAALDDVLSGKNESQQAMIRDSLTSKDENGNASPIGYADTFDVSDSLVAQQADLENEINEIQTAAQGERAANEEAYAQQITALRSEMNAEELAGLIALTTAAGAEMDAANQALVVGMTSTIEELVSELEGGGSKAADAVAGIVKDIGDEASAAKAQGKSLGEAIIDGTLAGLDDGGAIARKIASIVSAAIASAGGGGGGGDGGNEEPAANGRFVKSATHILAGEDGEEVIIPLSGKHRFRGLELWREAGKRLGVIGAIKSGISGVISGGDPVSTKTGRTIYQSVEAEKGVSQALDYDRLESVLRNRPAKFYLNSREFAFATADENNIAISDRKTLMSRGKGGRR